MPFTLEKLGRREFARNLLGAGLGIGAAAWTDRLRAEPVPPVDADRWTLLSDVHVAADAKTVNRGQMPAENLKRVVERLLERPTRPAHVLVNGDCAYQTGDPGDYATLVHLLAPLAKAGAPIHLTLGNHDVRDAFRAGVGAIRPDVAALESHETALVETPRADLVLLDSLDRTDTIPGRLGPKQLAWLDRVLARSPDKPAVIAVHHPPEFLPLPEPMGIVDTRAFLDVLGRRPRVKAVIFGHLHNWTHAEIGGIHYVGLPSTGYAFSSKRAIGWVEARLRDDGMTFELVCLDPQHRDHGKRFDVSWRART